MADPVPISNIQNVPTTACDSNVRDQLESVSGSRDAYPKVLDVHPWVSPDNPAIGQDAVIPACNDVYPEVFDVHHQVSHGHVGNPVIHPQVGCENIVGRLTALPTPDVYPKVFSVHSRVSHGQVEDAVIPDSSHTVAKAQVHTDVYPEVSDVHKQVSRTVAETQVLNPDAELFVMRDPDRVHRGVLIPDLAENWDQVQRVQSGNAGDPSTVTVEIWNTPSCGTKSGPEAGMLDELPFQKVHNLGDILGIAPKQIQKVNRLQDKVVRMPYKNFIDKHLPASDLKLVPASQFTPDYFVALHNLTSAPGYMGDGTAYDAFTPNHLGARIKLPHTKLRIERWRYHLIGYENVELIQHLEYGFPLGLQSAPHLESSSRNHGSSYSWYGHVDKFICKEISKGGMTGPFELAPWWDTVVSPLMTAHKKPLSRRTVFDATFGDSSLNNATPSDVYMGQPCQYTFPKIEDYRQMVLKAGPGSYMWKRDLSRFFLQLPLDPTEYRRVAVIWRSMFFFFLGLAFGLRHSGLNGQKVTDALTWILRRLGLECADGCEYSCCNYVDDIGGVESTKARAVEAFEKLGWLMEDLGLEESVEKAEPPTTCITYLGVQFDSIAMTMSVPPEKLTEIKAEIRLWLKRTTICKKELQSLLGKLFWIAKVVTYARAFMGRLLTQLRAIGGIPDHKKVKLLDESRKDILWWAEYLDKFNGINMIVNVDPIPFTYEQLLDTPYEICAGEATPTGAGAWHGNEYWSTQLPHHLQDPLIPIHLKEFWVMVVSAKQWGGSWTGRCLVMYSDNDAVVETLLKRKPKDPAMLSLLREFLFVVVTYKFYPVIRKIGTKENMLADFISRRFDHEVASELFSKSGIPDIQLVKPKARFFELSAQW